MGKIITEVPHKDTPDWWCVPPWHHAVEAVDRQWGKVFLKSGCKVYKQCPTNKPGCKRGAINCDPEAMRQDAQQKLGELGVLGPGIGLDLDTYSLARNIRSEFGKGTPEERVAIALATVNRARAESKSVTQYLLDTRDGLYGKQIGNVRPAATSQDPSVGDILLARFVLAGTRLGFLHDFTNGATHYFDRVSQDAAAARAAEEIRTVPSGEDVYKSWTGGGDMLTWVGHMPNVRTWRLAMFARRYDLGKTKAGRQERARVNSAGLESIRGKNRVPPPWDACPGYAERRFAQATAVWMLGVSAAVGLTAGLGVAVAVPAPPAAPRRA